MVATLTFNELICMNQLVDYIDNKKYFQYYNKSQIFRATAIYI